MRFVPLDSINAEITLHYDAIWRLQSSHSLSPHTVGSNTTLQLNLVVIDIDIKVPN